MTETWTVRSLLAWGRDWLGKKGVDSPRLDVELLLAHALGCNRTRLYIDMDKPLGADELGRFKPLVVRRGQREPVAYILGVKEFYGRPFAVGAGVFVPRPETELLVQAALEALPADRPVRALDLCAGSGAIGLSIAAERADAEVELVERSEAAAAYARRNAEALGGGRARVLLGDLWNAASRGPWDAVVSNPPYIAERDRAQLAPEILQHEPAEALFAGEDGLAVARRILDGLDGKLLPGGFFGMEIDPPQARAVQELCARAGLTRIRVVRDLAGLDRHVVARRD